VRLPGEPEYRSDLPQVERERVPVGYRPGLQLEERLQGLGAMLLGVVGLLVVYGIYTGFLPSGLPPPPPPPKGVLVQVPVVNAAACFIPLMAIGSVGLIVIGFRRVLDP
jgi:hypothetical protein